MKIFDRLFHLEEINGRGICPTYLYRWTLFRIPWTSIALYLHHFVGDDWSRDLHDHPKRFVSCGIAGSYIEETPRGERTYRAPWIRTFPAEHIHRIRLPADGSCWTLVAVLWTQRKWGFWNSGNWIPFRQYVDSDTAEDRKACP